MSSNQANQLIKALQENDLILSDEAQHKILRYLELIKTWNRVFNLTTITEPTKMIYLHIIDSLIVSPFLQGGRLLDVGSGAGLPGIPLAVFNPNQEWVLLDKNIKKIRFLTQVIAELQLTNATAIHSRSEDFHPAYCFDSILSRALGSLNMFVTSSEHLLCTNGIFIAMKGKYPQEELKELANGFTVQNSQRLKIKGMQLERHIVCITKGKGD